MNKIDFKSCLHKVSILVVPASKINQLSILKVMIAICYSNKIKWGSARKGEEGGALLNRIG